MKMQLKNSRGDVIGHVDITTGIKSFQRVIVNTLVNRLHVCEYAVTL